MPFQQAFLGESLVAKFALVQLLDKSLHYVDFPNFSSISLLMTLVHVRPQLLKRTKLPVTNRARVILARVVPLDVAHQCGVTAEHDRALGTLERFRTVDRPVEGEVFRRVEAGPAVTTGVALLGVMSAHVPCQQAGAAERSRTAIALVEGDLMRK